jgi:DNA-binding NarL/FixJ family response regulator
MEKHNLSVIIVEDHAILVEGLSSILSSIENITLSGAFYTAEDALQFLQANKADLVLLDISLPEMSGIELCRYLKKNHEDIKIIALTNYTEKSVIEEMLKNGADGYLLKNTSKQDLVNAMFQVMNNQFTMQSDLQKILFNQASPEQATPRLTTREKEVLQLVSQGITTSAIASRLFISPQTVETHRRNLMQKFEVANSAALIGKATRLGIL